jgi:hypothetical protein
MSRAADALQARAEILKLARILERDPDQLAYLEVLSLEDLRSLRDRITEYLWSAHGGTLNRLAAASRLLPAAVSATISERAFGPLLSARMAGLIEPARAVDIAGRLSPEFLADVAVELDPRRASAVIAGISPRQIALVTRELLAREEYVTMGRFVGHLKDAAIVAAVDEMDDGELLRVAFVLEQKQRLDRLVELLPERRLATIVQAASDEGLWVEALDLLDNLGVQRRDELVAAAVELDGAALEGLIAAVIEHELWEEVLVIAERDPSLQGRLAERLPSLPSAQRREVARRAGEAGAIERLGPLGEALSAQGV